MSSQTEREAGVPTAVHFWAWGLFGALVLVLLGVFLVYRDVDVWAGLQESGELRRPAYSETVYIESIFRTRANTWSNLAFVLVGFYAAVAAVRDRRNGPEWLRGGKFGPPALTALFGVACVYLGIGSGVFHASLTRWGQQLDVASMYPPMLALISIMIHRNAADRLPTTAKGVERTVTVALTAAILVAAILFYVYKWSMSSKDVLSSHVLALSVAYAVDYVLHRPRGRLRWLGLSFLALVAGVTCRQLDVAGNFSGPDAWYQGHSLWHGLCALSLWLGWRYLRDGATSGKDEAAESTA